MRKLLAALLAVSMLASLAACGSAPSSQPAESEPAVSTPVVSEPAEGNDQPEETGVYVAEEPLRVAGMKGPTTMGLVNLLNWAENGGEVGSYQYELYGAADEIVPLLVQGQLDAAAVPANLAATLYNRTEGAVQVACINTLGVLYVLEQGESIQSVADLAEATILSTGKGTTPEYVLRHVLSENGVDPDSDVTIEYLSEATEVTARLLSGEIEGPVVAMLPQPYVTTVLMNNENMRVALDMTEEWQKVAGSQLVTGVLLARTEAIEADPARFAQFLTDYAASVEAANGDLETTAALCEEMGIVGKAAIAQKAIPACNIVFLTGSEMQTALETYLQVLYDADPASVGGTLPDAAFYYHAD